LSGVVLGFLTRAKTIHKSSAAQTDPDEVREAVLAEPKTISAASAASASFLGGPDEAVNSALGCCKIQTRMDRISFNEG